jgi:hypothetical protein
MGMGEMVDQLAVRAFKTRHRSDRDVRAIRKALELFNTPGWITDEVPAVE